MPREGLCYSQGRDTKLPHTKLTWPWAGYQSKGLISSTLNSWECSPWLPQLSEEVPGALIPPNPLTSAFHCSLNICLSQHHKEFVLSHFYFVRRRCLGRVCKCFGLEILGAEGPACPSPSSRRLLALSFSQWNEQKNEQENNDSSQLSLWLCQP